MFRHTAIPMFLLLGLVTVSGPAFPEETVEPFNKSDWIALKDHAFGAETETKVKGSFRERGVTDLAAIVKNKKTDLYGVLLSKAGNTGAGAYALLKVFKGEEIQANPPSLSLVKPGAYQPFCAEEGGCQSTVLTHDGIGLCFGEASCEVIYFANGKFNEVWQTD